MKGLVFISWLLASCVLLTGCEDELEKLKLSDKEKEHVLALQNPFGENLVRLKTAGSDKSVLIGLLGCKLYRAEPEQGVVTEWHRVKEVDHLNFLSAGCESKSMKYDGKYLYFEYCSTAIGAGGGCGGGYGDFRTSNGSDWETNSKKGWVPAKK